MPPSPAPETSPSSGEDAWRTAWAAADAIPGWLKEGQARLLWDLALALPAGATVLEIGSHQGRSTVVLGHALRRVGGVVIAMDPFVEGRLFGGSETGRTFTANITAQGLDDVVRPLPAYSTDVQAGWTEPLDLLYVDGKHDYWTLANDLRFSRHLPIDGAVVVHDSFSSIGVTLGLLRHVLLGSDLVYVRRSDSQALFLRRTPTWRDRGRLVAQLPWWVRNVGLKVLLRLRLRPVARLLGHDSPYDPY